MPKSKDWRELRDSFLAVDDSGSKPVLAVHDPDSDGSPTRGWSLEFGREASKREFRHLASVGARLLGYAATADLTGWGDWLTSLSSESLLASRSRRVEFDTDSGSELHALEIPDVLRVSGDYCMCLANGSAPVRALPRAPVADSPTTADHEARTNEFLRECTEIAPSRISKSHIWKSVGHTSGTQFRRWKRLDERATNADKENFARILNDPPAAFITALQKKGLLK